ncbi:bifunctional hydroxymethylpyrimidine kinase/phosphomethylpyrimidine kinase [Halocalculus aciditolerans]|uniref:Pyridoxamine kinase/Phosphomethylpyrimidine kinase domain-containing protein n=1 Tax=Halocalculus aciditolerans TaxID=1383812 RepID=A0A830FJU1_9EURY|nr:bifunctional hydroxymethylpyrimidine kinase/phosphomethylpyrimidine kinase [Halocalculus aciditolerans]GGL63495.1 hypothetical protein GCM10009039_21770 [Halocalculus aciditolerans]
MTAATPPYALTVATSDSGGGAGIQADLKTMTRLGAYGGSVVVAATAQNTRSVTETHVLPTDAIRAQFDAVADDFDVRAVKVGMLAAEPAVDAVADCLAAFDCPVVLDPVLVSTAGDVLLDPDAIDAYDRLFDRSTVVTPNADEAETLTGHRPTDPSGRDAAAGWFLDAGADAVLLKGGHVDRGDGTVRDYLVTDDGTHAFAHDHLDAVPTHGSGCTLSSAIAARLAHGDALPAAVERATDFTHATLRDAADVGANGSVNHLASER